MKEDVDAEAIAAVVSRSTGIPVDKMMEGEREKLLGMEDALRNRVVGQDEALEIVANAVRRGARRTAGPNRPIGSFMSSSAPPASARPSCPRPSAASSSATATKKTAWSASTCPNTPAPAPPPACSPTPGRRPEGADQAVRQQPFSVLLLDEIEKAAAGRLRRPAQCASTKAASPTARAAHELPQLRHHHDLQPRRARAGGRQVGRRDLGPHAGRGDGSIRAHFRPEFLNRVDEIVFFQRLGRTEIDRIVSCS